MLFNKSDSTPDILTEFTDSLIDKRFAPVRFHIIKLIIVKISYIISIKYENINK